MSGKGDKPRNLSGQFRSNYDKIDWSKKPKEKKKVDKKPKRDNINQ